MESTSAALGFLGKLPSSCSGLLTASSEPATSSTTFLALSATRTPTTMAAGLEPMVITALIFGGCCTNVFALEAIVKTEPKSGLIITFFQFVFVTCLAYSTQVQPGAPYTLAPTKVPFSRWAFIAFMFYAINMLNNWAFAYNISVPVHIILRSFGSVTTMIAGFLRGKRYSKLQVFSVVLLTIGVLVSAWADSASKGKPMSIGSDALSSEFAQGLGILLVAQFASAYMGAYTEDTYSQFKASWKENLFYSHLFALPLFLPLAGFLREQYRSLAETPHMNVEQYVVGVKQGRSTTSAATNDMFLALLSLLGSMPQGILYLFTNAITQLVCISGVNLLSAKSSAVTVTIVLNIRKLVSFILSTMIFGHKLNTTMIIGSTLVFGSGALYGWETSWRIPRQRSVQAVGNGHLEGAEKDIKSR
ncbi:hypothetical protein AC578_6003 [Pseudocercospora eumusae]|uniref:Sugar phosphate transporter domain-containing protein n=1 Tax=Pseudocercospora eumusae TaxID=321146 RepID=A0A139HVL9_9PEZI|nr:hypothetical protein AC578_6003 [Pseudocercospora eumusae]